MNIAGKIIGDDTSFVVCNDSRVLGPFHPFDSITFKGDGTTGGEIHAEITLDLKWKRDSSVELACTADMATTDGPTDHAAGTTAPRHLSGGCICST